MEHPAVAEAGVIGIPDPAAGELVKAFVALKTGFEAFRCAAQGTAWPCALTSRPGRCAEGHRVSPEPAEDTQRQDYAPPPESA